MPKSPNQKLKLLYLAKLFYEKTDEEHGLTLEQIRQALMVREISADRKTLYDDFEQLRQFGMDIQYGISGGQHEYRLISRDFELAELKFLVDSVQSSHFLTEKKSKSLITKLERLASEHEARQLQRQVLITGRIKNLNESIYYNVDRLHAAINDNRQITFQYFQWNVKGEKQLKHNGARYTISPWHLVYDSERYYLIGYDAESDCVKHFRVDKMLHIEKTDRKRRGGDKVRKEKVAANSKIMFGMFGGKPPVNVTVEGDLDLAFIFIDRFGKDILLYQKDENSFSATFKVVPSEIFYGWIIGLGDRIRITEPQSVVDEMVHITRRLAKTYLSDAADVKDETV